MSNILFLVLLILSSALVLTSGRRNNNNVYVLAQSATPLPEPSQTCLDKSQNDLKVCGDQAQKQWKITEDQLDGKDQNVPAQNYCCAYWQASDCSLGVFKKYCNLNDLDIIQKAQTELIKSKYGGRCANYTYHSDACPVMHTISISIISKDCSDKTKDSAIACYDKTSKQWNLTRDQFDDSGKNVPAENYCCAHWEASDCISDVVQKTCNSTDIADFKELFNFMVKDINAGKCQKFTYHSDKCPGSNSNKLNNINSVILCLIISLVIFFKK